MASIEAQLQALEADLVAEGVASFAQEPALPVCWVACRTIFQRGFPLEGPAISFVKGNVLLGSGWDILNALDPISVTIQDDEEWFHFPEIGVAYQKMTAIENHFAVAFSTQFSKWGVGFGNGKKTRESASRLALAVAIISGSPHVAAYDKRYPGLASLCVAPTGSNENVSRGFAEESAAGHGYDVARGFGHLRHGFAEANNAAQIAKRPAAGDAPPQVYWVSLREDSRMVERGWTAQVPAIVHDRSQQSFFSIASSLLDDVLGNSVANFYHEADWKQFPEVGEALKLAMGPKASEYSFCVATCNELNQWAFGLAWGKKTMEVAAKLALAYQMALTSGRMRELMKDYPEFNQLVQGTGADYDGMVTKRARLGTM